MHLRYLFITFISLLIISCESSTDKKEKDVEYSYSCLDIALGGSQLNKTLDKAGGIIRDIAVNEDKITDEVQNEYGAAFHKDVIDSKTFKLMNDAAIQAELALVMNDLLKVRKRPSEIKYQIYAVNDSMVNAFTFGGRIYVTKGMLNRCKGNRSLLYAIIGHEIGHSERGHVKKTIHEMMTAEKIFGEQNGATALDIIRLLTGSFNQRNELEADFYGADLANELNHDLCVAVEFWKDMAKQENQYNRFEDFFRTHPFSSLRAQCLEQHLAKNFGKNCSSAQ